MNNGRVIPSRGYPGRALSDQIRGVVGRLLLGTSRAYGFVASIGARGSVSLSVETGKPCARLVVLSNRPELKHPGYGAKPGKPGSWAPAALESPIHGALLCSAAASSQSAPCPKAISTEDMDWPFRPRLDLSADRDIMDRGQDHCAVLLAASLRLAAEINSTRWVYAGGRCYASGRTGLVH